MNYYNENDPQCCAWLANLIAAGLIPDGKIDSRSIEDVQPGDLDGFDQCHFFAGIAGWPLALKLAGVPSTEPLWTGSCPCQPFSCAGKGEGVNDKRHLWPELRRLIAECRPATVIGEQVASKDGRAWLAGVFADVEALGYAAAGADLCAAGVGSPHIRQRLYWLADAERAERRPSIESGLDVIDGDETGWTEGASRSGLCRTTRRLADAHEPQFQRVASSGEQPVDEQDLRAGRLGHAEGDRPQRRASVGSGTGRSLPPGAWCDSSVIECTDEKQRRIERGTFPLAHGIPRDMGRGQSRPRRMAIRAARANRVCRLRGYGNAIVPQVAAEFIQAWREATCT